MPANAVIIGRVAVKVLPDTSKFREETEAKLARLERKLKVKVHVEPDTTGLAQKVKVAARAAQKQIEDLKIRVNLDNQDSVSRGIARIQAELEKLRETEINVDLNDAALTTELKRLERRFKEIERLELRIDPKSEKSLEAALARIDAELAKRTELKVKLKTDTSSLQAAAKEIRDKLQAAAQIKINADKAKADADARASADRIQRALNQIDFKIKPGMDRAKFAEVGREIERTVEKMDALHATITPEMDKHARRKVEREIDELAHKVDKLKSSVQPDVSEPHKLAAAASLAKLTRDRVVHIFPVVSKPAVAAAASTLAALSGARALNSVFGDIGRMLKNLDKSVPLIGTIALAILGLAGYALTAAANLAALSASLASIAPAALALPGILGGMAVGLTVTVIAFKDINKIVPEVKSAWGKLKKTISENFWAKAAKPIRSMVDNLLPTFTNGFAKASSMIGGYFGALAGHLTNSFKPAVGGMFKDLAKSVKIATGGTNGLAQVITILGTQGAHQLPRLATYFSEITNKFAAFLHAAADDGRLQGWIDSAINLLTQLGHALKSIGGILSGIGKAALAGGGSGLSPFADTLERINKVVNGKTFQTALTKTFGAAFQMMHNISAVAGPALMNLFTQLSKTFQTIMPLAGKTIGTVFKTIADTLADPAMQSGIKSLFRGIDKGVRALAPAVRALAPVLGHMLEVIGQFAAKLGPLFAAALDTLAPLFDDLLTAAEPLIDVLMDGLTATLRALGPSLKVVGKALVDVAVPLAHDLGPILGKIVPQLGRMADILAKNFADMLPVLADLFLTLAQAVADALPPLVDAFQELAPIIPPLARAFVDMIKPLAKQLAPILKTVLPPLVKLVQLFADAAADVLPPLAQAFADLLPKLAPVLAALLSMFVDVMKPLLPVIVDFVKTALPPLVDIMAAWLDILGPLLEDLRPFVQLLAGISLGGLLALTAAFEGLVATLKALHDMWQGLSGFWSALKSTLSNAWDNVKSSFGIGGGDLKAVATKQFWDASSAITDAVSTWPVTMSNAWDRVIGVTQDKAGTLQSLIDHKFQTASSAIGNSANGWGAQVGNGWDRVTATTAAKSSELSRFAVSGMNGVKGAFTNALGAIRTTVGDWWHDIEDIWQRGWDILHGKAVQGTGHLSGALQIATGTIKAAVGDWSNTLSGAGSSLMDGLVNGIQANQGKVESQLRALTAKLPHWKGPKPVDKKLLYNAGQLIIDGLVRGLGSRFGQVQSALGNLTTAIATVTDKGLRASLANSSKHLKSLAAAYDSTVTKVKDATAKLNQLRQEALSYRDSIATSIVGQASVVDLGGTSGSFAAIIDGLKEAQTRAKAFAETLAKLKVSGLNKTAIDQLAKAGPEAALEAAKNILASGKTGIKQLNGLQDSIGYWAKQAGTVAMDAMYRTGLNAAEGIVKGLEKGKPQIQAEMLDIAKKMVATIKAELHIKSPSRVFMSVGGFIGAGLLNGLESTYDSVHRSLRRFSKDIAATDFGSPTVQVGAQLNGIASKALAPSSGQQPASSSKTLNYYAAPGNSLSSEEDLFAASSRARYVW